MGGTGGLASCSRLRGYGGTEITEVTEITGDHAHEIEVPPPGISRLTGLHYYAFCSEAGLLMNYSKLL